MRELDLLLGGFADAHIEGLTPPEIEQYERLLDVPDTELLGWVTGQTATPAEFQNPLLERIVTFRRPSQSEM